MKRAVIASIVGLLLTSGGYLYGQQQAQTFMVQPETPTIKSGADIGFRIEGTKPGVVVGRLVVRSKNGEWVEAEFSGGTRLLSLETR